MRSLFESRAVSVLTVILLTCLVAALANVSQADVTGGYMASASDGLVYLRITQVGSKLSGYVQLVQGSDLHTTQGFSIKQQQVAGDISGSSFSLGHNLESFLGGSIGPCEGTRKAGKLVLQFPAGDGRTTTEVFRPVSTNTWNSAVEAFKKKRTTAAYVQRWSDALWNRQRELCGDYTETENGVKSSADELEKHQGLAEEARGRLGRIDDALKKTKEVMAKSQDSVKAAEKTLTLVRDRIASAQGDKRDAFDAACADVGAACAASAELYHTLAADCGVSSVRSNLLLGESNFHYAENNVRLARSNIQRSRMQSDRNDAESNLRDAEGNLRDVSGNLRDVEGDLRDVEGDIRDLQGERRDADSSLKEAESNIAKCKAEIESGKQKISEISAELDYLTAGAIANLMSSFHKGIPVALVISSTTVNEHPSSTSTALYRADARTCVAVLPNPQRDWCPVLLPDSKISWIGCKHVRVVYGPSNAQARSHEVGKGKPTSRRKR